MAACRPSPRAPSARGRARPARRSAPAACTACRRSSSPRWRPAPMLRPSDDEEVGDAVCREMRRVPSNCMCSTKCASPQLVVVFEHRAGLDHQPQFGAARRLRVRADVVAQAVRQRPDDDLRVHRHLLRQGVGGDRRRGRLAAGLRSLGGNERGESQDAGGHAGRAEAAKAHIPRFLSEPAVSAYGQTPARPGIARPRPAQPKVTLEFRRDGANANASRVRDDRRRSRPCRARAPSCRRRWRRCSHRRAAGHRRCSPGGCRSCRSACDHMSAPAPSRPLSSNSQGIAPGAT